MSRLHQTFDASQIDPSAALAVIPAGRYVGQIVIDQALKWAALHIWLRDAENRPVPVRAMRIAWS